MTRIENAKTLEKRVQDRVKRDKFDSIMQRQLEGIKRRMSEYDNSCNFFFADNTLYNRDFEKQWKAEFCEKATTLFEKKGYKIVNTGRYTLITW